MATPRLARLTRRAGLTVLTTLALVAGGLAATPAADAASPPTPNPYSPAYQHPYRHGVVPTIPTAARMNTYVRTHHSVPLASANNLNYGGGIDGIGVTTGHQKVYLIFYGSQWGSAGTDSNGNTTLSGDPSGEAPYLQNLFKGLGGGGELWSGVMTQYCEGVATGSQTCPASSAHVGYPTGGALSGVWVDNAAASPQQASGHTLALEAISAASHFGNTTAASNRNAQYVVLSPTGTTPDGFNTPGGGFCAWHDYNGDSTLTGGAASSPYGDIAFTNSPYVTDAGSGCGQNFVNGSGTLDGVSIVEGHEYAETVTDQNPAGGWTDSSGAENGDKCAWIAPGQSGGAANLSLPTGSFAMQATWGNDGSGGTGTCQFSHPIVGGGTTGNTVTVTQPASQNSTVGTAVSLQIQASDSASGQTLTYSATGLPAGLSINSASGLISGTPTTTGTSSVTVKATDTTNASGSASFSWTVSPVLTGGITNGGFETGSLSGWTATGALTGVTTSGPHSGTYAALLGSSTTPTNGASSIAQTFNAPTGSTHVSFWYNVTCPDTVTYDWATATLKDNTSGTTSTVLAKTCVSSSGWKQVTATVTAGHSYTLTLTSKDDNYPGDPTSTKYDDVALS
ncbi:MAG TPA: putative Ig domain-containing protein [Streptosporangiaceae bacterium]|nr:putative Ig domain-containing protein [Streptosporangiaceae bacterium]